MSPDVVNSLFDAMLRGLEDYTVDERGDVGSWIRIACTRGLTSFCVTLISNGSTIVDFEEYLPSSKYQDAISGILKQGVERLDNVRTEAGECFKTLLRLASPLASNAEEWKPRGLPLLDELFNG